MVNILPVYNIHVEGKPFKIELIKTGTDSFIAKIGEKEKEIKFSKDEESGTFLIFVGDKKYKVELEKISRRKPFSVKVNEIPFKVEIKPLERPVKALATTAVLPSAETKKAVKPVVVTEGAVVAPMTGKIVSVKVKEGDEVKAGQVLCILEAMKMENEIAAPKSGKVKELNVSEGSSVNEGEVLAVIE